jgi:hypothetical protein
MVLRVVVFTLSLLGFLVCAALAVREVALAFDDDASWGTPDWYRDAVADGTWERAGGAGLVVLGVVILCLVLVVLRLTPRRSPALTIQFGQPDARVTVPVDVLERLLAVVLATELRGTARVRRVRLAKRQGRFATRARLSVVPTDLVALHARALSLVRRDLGAAGGLEVDRLVLEIDRFIHPEEATP